MHPLTMNTSTNFDTNQPFSFIWLLNAIFINKEDIMKELGLCLFSIFHDCIIISDLAM